MKLTYNRMIVVVMAVVCIGFSPANAANGAKRTLKGNMTEVYRQEPLNASDFSGMFSEGLFYEYFCFAVAGRRLSG